MADDGNRNDLLDVPLLKNKRISVLVDEALPDILLVSYEHGLKIFRGVLLDSTKKNLPCGIANLNPAFTAKADDDSLYSVSQRFAYTDPRNAATKKKNVQISSKYKNSKMTVRLRPRQVLCSKCKGICNENSENVSRKRKSSDSIQPVPPIKRGANAPITRSVYSVLNKKKEEKSQEKKPLSPTTNDNIKCNGENSENDAHSTTTHSESTTPKSVRRKKRSVGSVEEHWDEAVLEEKAEQTCTNTRTIKISFGPQGEGTVLKIPAKIDNLVVSDDSEENVDADGKSKQKESNYKAAKRALKRAKKEARRKILLAGSSPCYLGGASPRYSFAGASPRYTVGSASPRNGLGNNSPRYAAATYELNVPRRRKHKVKHKKKHKEDRDKKHKDSEVTSTQDDTAKEHCITQKLSINLKRLNNTYTSCRTTTTAAATEETHSSSDEHSEQVPDFPSPNPPLMLRVNAQTVTSAPGADGGRLLVGDVVWGKIQGFPWWPGKVLTITNQENQGPQAQVAWYGSSTSSLMQCDQLSPYLENFKIRYNKKKRGPYKEAIRQATTEARENAENRLRESLVNASPARNIMTVVQPALASPREIDVVS